MRQLAILLTLSSIVFLCTGCVGDLLGGPDSCHSRYGEESCDAYNNKLTRCYSDGILFNLPNCDVVEYCTDYPTDDDTVTSSEGAEVDIDTDSSTDSDTTTDSTTVPKGRVCRQVCEGDLIPCEDLGKERCESAFHCDWYGDAL